MPVWDQASPNATYLAACEGSTEGLEPAGFGKGVVVEEDQS